MTEPSPTPRIRAALNGEGELELTAVNAPAGAVIRMDVNASSPRMLCTQGRYLAPVQAPPGTRIRFRLFQGKRGLTEPETFIMPGTPPARTVPSTLIPCTQNRDFMIYDWAARHEAACRAVRETHPDLLFIGDSITHFWGGLPVDEPHRDILQKSPETWNLCTAGMRAVNLGFGYDRVENALWRLRHGELDGAADDAVCVVLLGTNNLAENTDGEILRGIRAVCREITGRLKKAVIILQGFYPRNSAREDTAERIAAINLLLDRLAAEQGFLYTEPGRVMADAAGHVPEELSSDGLHPSAAGYERIAAVLAPAIRQAAERKK
ncbi:GDSL-type esterase/lipase family protein [Akkermansia sp.]|uniref:GDSL-type esterase/lipase family protein n=1 Tax=Akkermansia sp. TaxID=1872421 RepID=UPI0025C57606|nr:GDSL-type esterase/lipase family protein [Akkermansia sp.]MCD8063880.1 GDSL-type esterase/lipase family protein [Akkermansia sp.]